LKTVAFLEKFFVVLILLGLVKVWSMTGPGFFDTDSAYFFPTGHLALSLGYDQYLSYSSSGNLQKHYNAVPFNLSYALARNVQVGISIPLIWVAAPKSGKTLGLVGGDGLVELHFGNDETEYDYRESFLFKVRIPDASPPVGRDQRLSTAKFSYSGDEFVIKDSSSDYYPLIKHNGDLTLGWNFSKQILPKTFVHFNARYVYEFSTNESLTNIFAFNGLIDTTNDVSTTSNFDNYQGAKFSLFGIEKIFQKFFYSTSFSDPWADKKNDHLELSLALDTTLDVGFDLFEKHFSLAIRPFSELFFLKRFTEESLYKSNLTWTVGAGIFLPFGLRYQFGFSHVFWSENRYDFEDSARMNLTWVF
jgi:hypothetical protein